MNHHTAKPSGVQDNLHTATETPPTEPRFKVYYRYRHIDHVLYEDAHGCIRSRDEYGKWHKQSIVISCASVLHVHHLAAQWLKLQFSKPYYQAQVRRVELIKAVRDE